MVNFNAKWNGSSENPNKIQKLEGARIRSCSVSYLFELELTLHN